MAKAIKRAPRPKRSASFDVAKWAETTQHTRRGPMCGICKHKDAAEAVAIIVKARHEGRSVVSITQTCAMLQQEFGLKVCRTSLSAHVEVHLGARW